MKQDLTQKNKYSKIQYFFWLLSGAEISVLKDCPTDYNRQAGIGFTVFMTTLLAFFSGSYAGYYFGENYFSAIIFGAIWASLIFSIDRSMVITLKKDPTQKKQNFWPAFLSRCVLAILIAFIISIPLELLIFKESIDLHMDKFKLDQVYSIQQAAIRNEDMSAKQSELDNVKGDLSKVESELVKGEPEGDPEYDQLKRDIEEKQRKYNHLLNNLNHAQGEVARSLNSVPVYHDVRSGKNLRNRNSSQWRIYQTRLNQKKQAQNDINRFDNKRFELLKARRKNYISDWAVNLKANQKALNGNITQTRAAISRSMAKNDSVKNVFQGKISEKKGFVLRFMVLEDLAKLDAFKTNTKDNTKNQEGATIFMLLWLIRILFFTVEILPTIAKIATPIGAYDKAIYRKEMDIELELGQRTDGYLEQRKALREIEYRAEREQTKGRTQIENKLHKELLLEIAEVQNSVAKQKIEEFKNKHISSFKNFN